MSIADSPTGIAFLAVLKFPVFANPQCSERQPGSKLSAIHPQGIAAMPKLFFASALHHFFVASGL